MTLYSIGNACHRKNISLIPRLVNILIRLIYNCVVYTETQIGRGRFFTYGGIAVVVHKKAVIGSDCVIGSNVTIGGQSKSVGVPNIGNDVYIATAAKILSDIMIGNNCVIGANAVVITDVPDNAMVAGVPAKVIRTNIVSRGFF
jgi:serine O-acetyltransferase